MITGLFVGKCAPFHLGHAKIIEKALIECDKVMVFIYNSAEFDQAHPKLDKVLRASWVKETFPQVEVRVGYNPPPDDYTPEGDARHALYIDGHLPLRWKDRKWPYVDMVYGGEEWVDNLADFWGAKARRHQRQEGHISASLIRDDPAAYAWYMPPVVRDWMLSNYKSKLPLLPR